MNPIDRAKSNTAMRAGLEMMRERKRRFETAPNPKAIQNVMNSENMIPPKKSEKSNTKGPE